jgi:hypothetical protein
MRYSFVALGVLATVALTAAPVSQASAHGGHWRGPRLVFGLAAAVVGTAAVIATAPFRAIAGAPVYAAPPPVYYAPPQQAYYAPPPGYYAPPPYYAAPPGYYPR